MPLFCGPAIVGRTPWSARVPPDPLFAPPNQPHAIPERPARAPAADQGVRPTINAGHPIVGKAYNGAHDHIRQAESAASSREAR
jgi:hypothetical protein